MVFGTRDCFSEFGIAFRNSESPFGTRGCFSEFPIPVWNCQLHFGTPNRFSEFRIARRKSEWAFRTASPFWEFRIGFLNSEIDFGIAFASIDARATEQKDRLPIPAVISGFESPFALPCARFTSTLQKLSANGPILPLGAPLMALTPLSPFRPRRWRGALLPDTARVVIDVLEADKRPVAAAADHFEIRRVTRVAVAMDKATSLILLLDPGHSLDERILREQFGY